MAATRTPQSPDRIAVPRLNRDPVQSLTPFPVEVSIGGRDYTIPALPASVWLSVIMVDNMDMSDIFPGLLEEEDQDEFEERVIYGNLEMDELQETILGVIEVASARHWYVTLRLIEMARTSWDVLGGELGLKGIDPTRMSLAHWLDVLVLITIRSMEPKDVQMWTMKLEAPPPNVEPDEEDTAISESAFMAMAG